MLLAQAASGQAPSDDSYAVWAVVLLGVAVVLFFVEIIVPSGGIIGVFSAVSLVMGIVMLFRINTVLGLVGAMVSLIAAPFLFFFALKLWPSTPIAQMLLLKDTRASTHEGDHPADASTAIVGLEARALTDLRPVGTCLINGQRRECLAVGGVIRAGATVRVVSATGMEIKVRPMESTGVAAG